MKKLYIVVIVFTIALASGYFGLQKILYSDNIQIDKKSIFIDIPDKANIDDVKNILKPYLKSSTLFDYATKIKRFKKVYSGRYKIDNNMSNNQLINMLRIGKQIEINVTFNNQNSLESLAGSVSKYISADSISLLRAFNDDEYIHKNGFTSETALLMYIPNTYKFYFNTDAEKFRNKMNKYYHKFWTPQRIQAAKKIGLTPIEVGILASIIQKESHQLSELPRIAGVYLNRIKNNWLLQADPTVVFAYKQKYGKDLIIKRVLNKHKEVVSPYNTYMYAGLPPGPICMPDTKSINAVLHAEQHNYYFFVADFNKPGFHIFSKNLNDHNKHANKYHRQLNKNKIYR